MKYILHIFFNISSNNKTNLNTDIELNQKETTKNEVLYTDERTDEIQMMQNEKIKTNKSNKIDQVNLKSNENVVLKNNIKKMI